MIAPSVIENEHFGTLNKLGNKVIILINLFLGSLI